MCAQRWDAAEDGGLPGAVYRQALGRFGSGVTVISVAHAGGYHAMTANAFMSISLDPPLVAVSIGRKARMNEHLAERCRFGISVLSEPQQALAFHFGGRPDPAVQPAVEWEQGVPLMAGSAATLVVDVDRIHEAGDHRIFVAQLCQLRWSEAPPLIFWAGRFGQFVGRTAAPPTHPTDPHFWC